MKSKSNLIADLLYSVKVFNSNGEVNSYWVFDFVYLFVNICKCHLFLVDNSQRHLNIESGPYRRIISLTYTSIQVNPQPAWI